MRYLVLINVFVLNFGYCQTVFFQNTNENIWTGNSASCTASMTETIQNNSYLRVFETNDFNIQDTVFFLFIELGVESTTGGDYKVYGKVHELNGDLLFSNMTLLSVDTNFVFPDSSIYRMKIPLDSGYALPGDTLVTEVFAPLNNSVTFFPGSNPYLENGPSYIAAPSCGLAQPTPFSAIGYETTKLVLKLWVNHKPSCNDFDLSVFKNENYQFLKSEFEDVFEDHDDDTLQFIKISTLPDNGILYKNVTALNVGDTVWSYELNLLSYEPFTEYFGNDQFSFFVRDGYHMSNASTTVEITVLNWQLSSESFELNELQVYPNPSTEIIYIEAENKEGLVRIFNACGDLVLTENTKGNVEINALSPGIYFLTFENESGVYQSKFIKQ